MSFQDFRCFVLQTTDIVSLDLDQLQQIADIGNATAASSSTITQSTRRPEDEISCSDTPPDISRCTIPIAMVCFSIIDMVGQWLNENNNDDFGHSANAFFNKLSGKDDLKNHANSSKLKEYFRHGIMHSFFAKKGYSVAYPSHDNNSLFIDLDTKASTLDVRYLLKEIRSGMEVLKNKLQDDKSEFSKLIYEGYQRWLIK